MFKKIKINKNKNIYIYIYLGGPPNYITGKREKVSKVATKTEKYQLALYQNLTDLLPPRRKVPNRALIQTLFS